MKKEFVTWSHQTLMTNDISGPNKYLLYSLFQPNNGMSGSFVSTTLSGVIHSVESSRIVAKAITRI